MSFKDNARLRNEGPGVKTQDYYFVAGVSAMVIIIGPRRFKCFEGTDKIQRCDTIKPENANQSRNDIAGKSR